MGAREYDPSLGRWLSADTIVPNPANPQSFNRFAYVYNNPLRYTDPTGHKSRDEIKKCLTSNGDLSDDEAEDLITYWENYRLDWWQLLLKAENGDLLDSYHSEHGGRVVGWFYEDDEGRTQFTYYSFSDSHWDMSAQYLLDRYGPSEGLHVPSKYPTLAWFSQSTAESDVILARSDDPDNPYALYAVAGTGVCYNSTGGIANIQPRYINDLGVGLFEYIGGAVTAAAGGGEIIAGLGTSPIGWPLVGKGVVMMGVGGAGIAKGAERIARFSRQMHAAMWVSSCISSDGIGKMPPMS